MSEADLYKSFINANSFSKIEKTVINDLKDSELFQKSPLSSAYSYGPPCAVNLVQDRDLSAEEARFQFYQARQNGTSNQYEVEMSARGKDMEKCFSHIRSHHDWAARFMQKSTRELKETGQLTMKSGFINFPLDLSGQSGSTMNTSSTFGQNPFTQTSSTFGSTSGAFGQGTSQNNSQPFSSGGTSGAFGGPSSTGQGLGGVFGKPNFGGSSSAFGAQPAANTFNAFGSSMTTQATAPSGSVFGQPQFGSGQATGSAFGAPKFGNTSVAGNTFGGQSGSAFGTPSFGSSQKFTAASTANSPFSSLQNNAAANNSLGESAQSSSPFGSLQNKSSGTSNTSPFASLQKDNTPGITASPFASLQNGKNTMNSGNAFGQPANANAIPFGNMNTTNTFGSQANGTSSFSNSSAFNNGVRSPFAQNTTASTTSMPMTTNGTVPKFAQGLPSKEDSLKTEDLDKQTLEQFQASAFTLGKVPDVPPPLALVS